MPVVELRGIGGPGELLVEGTRAPTVTPHDRPGPAVPLAPPTAVPLAPPTAAAGGTDAVLVHLQGPGVHPVLLVGHLVVVEGGGEAVGGVEGVAADGHGGQGGVDDGARTPELRRRIRVCSAVSGKTLVGGGGRGSGGERVEGRCGALASLGGSGRRRTPSFHLGAQVFEDLHQPLVERLGVGGGDLAMEVEGGFQKRGEFDEVFLQFGHPQLLVRVLDEVIRGEKCF